MNSYEATLLSVRLRKGVLWFAGVSLVLLMMIPLSIFAQADITARGDLSVAIRNAIMSDPRAQNLSLEEVAALTYALTEKAVAQGITQHDLYWRPMLAHTVSAADEAAAARNYCGSVPEPLCSFNKYLGLSGSDMTVPIALAVLVILILALAAGFLELQHRNRLRAEVRA